MSLDFHGLKVDFNQGKYARSLCEVDGCEEEYAFIVESVMMCKKHTAIVLMVAEDLSIYPRKVREHYNVRSRQC